MRNKLLAAGFVVVLTMVALVGWRLFPRYELRPVNAAITYRLDRWTGDVWVLEREQESRRIVLRPVSLDYLDALDQVQREGGSR